MSEDHVTIKTPEFVSLQFQLAGLGSRASAMIVDQALLLLANIAVILFVYFGMQVDVGAPSFLFALAILVLFITRWGYFFVCEYFFGGKTVGKKLTGIRVVQENGHSITLASSFIRNLLRIVDTLPSGYFVGIIMVFFHPRHKRLGDVVSGTIVVYEREAKKKTNPIDKVVESRGLSTTSIPVSEREIQSLGAKDWELLHVYSERVLQMDAKKRDELTKQVSLILLPKVNIHTEDKTIRQLEDTLLVLYLLVKDEWAYEL